MKLRGRTGNGSAYDSGGTSDRQRQGHLLGASPLSRWLLNISLKHGKEVKCRQECIMAFSGYVMVGRGLGEEGLYYFVICSLVNAI